MSTEKSRTPIVQSTATRSAAAAATHPARERRSLIIPTPVASGMPTLYDPPAVPRTYTQNVTVQVPPPAAAPPGFPPGSKLLSAADRSRLTPVQLADLERMERIGVPALPVATQQGTHWRRPDWLDRYPLQLDAPADDAPLPDTDPAAGEGIRW